jgi:hypothetical protein
VEENEKFWRACVGEWEASRVSGAMRVMFVSMDWGY